VKPLGLPEDEKATLIKQLDIDSAFLRDQNLIDYSLFLLQVDRIKILKKEDKSLVNFVPKLVFEKNEGTFRLTFEKKKSDEDESTIHTAINEEATDDDDF